MDQIKEQNPQVPMGGKILQGDLAVPESACGVVLFTHGSGSSRHSPRNRYVARVLREAGLATLLIDLLTPEGEAFDADTAWGRCGLPAIQNRRHR